MCNIVLEHSKINEISPMDDSSDMAWHSMTLKVMGKSG
jgi:hypothetical protein